MSEPREPSEDDYLFDPSAPPDPEIVRLERALAPLRYVSGREFQARPRSRRRLFVALALAAAGLIGLGSWRVWAHRARVADVADVAETRVISGELAASSVRPGTWLATGTAGARLRLEGLGTIDVEPGARMRLVAGVDARKERRLELVAGTIHARVDAPPRFFVVDTPSAAAVDLGCAYTMTVTDHGTALRVTAGYVALEGGARAVTVPAGASCTTRVGDGPGAPSWDDASEAFHDAYRRWETAAVAGDLGQQDAALGTLCHEARRRDTLTLYALLPRLTDPQRHAVFSRLSELAPPPPTVHEAEPASLEGWRPAVEATW